MIGVLGGMGPLATAHFFRRLVELTPATCDRDHVPVIVWSDPAIPDRVGPITAGRGPSPLPAMVAGVRALEAAGTIAVAIVCNTAHHWYDDIVRAACVPVLHIADAAVSELPDVEGPVGLLATRGTLLSGFYQNRLSRLQRTAHLPTDREHDELLVPGIAAVKAGDVGSASTLFARAAAGLEARGSVAIVLACTEISVGWRGDLRSPVVDATDALARLCIEVHRRST